jgi:hypothetical protein
VEYHHFLEQANFDTVAASSHIGQTPGILVTHLVEMAESNAQYVEIVVPETTSHTMFRDHGRATYRT